MYAELEKIPESEKEDIPADPAEDSGKKRNQEPKEATRPRPNPMPVSIVIQGNQNQKRRVGKEDSEVKE